MSDPRFVKSRVPQGSIFGPLSFLYVNYMASSICSYCTLISYADDSAFCLLIKNLNFILEKLDAVLKRCSLWLMDNMLSLHLDKTECILFKTKKTFKMYKIFVLNVRSYFKFRRRGYIPGSFYWPIFEWIIYCEVYRTECK